MLNTWIYGEIHLTPEKAPFPCESGDYVFVPDIREKLSRGDEVFPAKILRADGSELSLTLYVKGLTAEEKQIILDGCLINYYAAHRA